MRNILVFPDGSRQSFQYPDDREIHIGTEFACQDQSNNEHYVKVIDIHIQGASKFYMLAYR